MIVITGGTGFIGSNLVNSLNESYNIYVSDWIKPNIYLQNFDRKKIVNPEKLINFININKNKITSIIHLGAITSTTEKNVSLILNNNVFLSEYLWNFCCINKKGLFMHPQQPLTEMVLMVLMMIEIIAITKS